MTASLTLKSSFREDTGKLVHFQELLTVPSAHCFSALDNTWSLADAQDPRPLSPQDPTGPSPFLGQEEADCAPFPQASPVSDSRSLRGRPQEPAQDVENCK